MKKIFIAFIVAALLTLLLTVIAGISSDADEPAPAAAGQQVITLQASAEDALEIDSVVEAEASEPEVVADRVLADMNDAGVEERTGELMLAFNHLEKLCNDAVATYDAMLSASFDGGQTQDAAPAQKGSENGDE